MGKFYDMLNSPEMEELRKNMKEAQDRYKKEVFEFWDNLSYDEQLMAFFYVTSMIYKGDVEQLCSYRGVLYEIFGFESDAYIIGMDSGYLNLHNIISYGVDFQKFQQAKSIKIGDETISIGSDKKFEFYYDEETGESVIKIVDLMDWEL